jgi:hypothetical protein
MYEGFCLLSIGPQFSEDPPSWICIFEVVERCRHFAELQAQPAHKEIGSGVVRDESRLLVVRGYRSDRQNPRKQMVSFAEPYLAVMRDEGFGPK